MRNLVLIFFALLFLTSAQPDRLRHNIPAGKAQNLIIVIVDGLRWQEIFTGADPALISDERYSHDKSLQMLYGGKEPEERRDRLFPFLWEMVASGGQLYGNRSLGSRVNSSNLYSISYPGYNEIFTGNTDLLISSNRKRNNPHINVLEYLNSRPGFVNDVVAFTSWDVFPFILNRNRSGLLINSGKQGWSAAFPKAVVSADESIEEGTRSDAITYTEAMTHLDTHRPRILFLGLGETDEYAHRGRYDLYLHHAHKADSVLSELWKWVQATPGYRDNTTLLITTDHGRGAKTGTWSSHGAFIKGSSETWFGIMGPGVEALGEMRKNQQYYQLQLAGTIADIVGEKFNPH